MGISVIVPFLNEDLYIRQCIESLLEQDFSRDRYELIFVDNGSTDSSARIVEQYPDVKLLSETKGKVYTARNTGIDAATGEIMAFTDADCTVSPNWLSCIHEEIAAKGKTIVLGRILFPAPKSDLLQIIENYRNDHIEYVVENNFRDHMYGYTNNMAVRADVFERVGPFVDLPVPGDTEIVHRCLRLIPDTQIVFRPDMLIDHLEIVNSHILLKKLYLYGKFHMAMEPLDTGIPKRLKPVGAEAYSVRKNDYSLRQRLLFRLALFLCNSYFDLGKKKEWVRQHLFKSRRRQE